MGTNDADYDSTVQLSDYRGDYLVLKNLGFICESDPPEIADKMPHTAEEVKREIAELSGISMEMPVTVSVSGHELEGTLHTIIGDWDFTFELRYKDGEPAEGWLRILRTVLVPNETPDILSNLANHLDWNKGEIGLED